MVTESKSEPTVEGLEALASAIEALTIAPIAAMHGELETRRQLVRTIRSYLIPRLADPKRPLTVVFAGPTGAGKSTLLNSVAGAPLTATGSLRPTTRSPVVFAGASVARSYGNLGGIECDVVVGRAPILDELTLVDTPDIDSTSTEHRQMAEALIDISDVVIFVSSALRYADSVPWEVLRRARSRGAPVLCVLNRIRPDSAGALYDYGRLLRAEGMGDLPIAVGEHHLEVGAFAVPSGSVRDLRTRMLSELEAHRRASFQTWSRVLAVSCQRATDLVDSIEKHADRRRVFEWEVSKRLSPASPPYIEDYGPGGFPADQITHRSGRARLRDRLWMRFALPRGEDLEAERTRLVETLVTHQELSLRAITSELRGHAHISGAEYDALRRAVAQWMAQPDAGGRYVARRIADAVHLLRRISASVKSDWPARVLSLITTESQIGAVRNRLSESLRVELEPVYRNLELKIRRELAPVTIQGDIEAARVAIAGVSVGFSLADA